MSHEIELAALHARIMQLETQLEVVCKHLGLPYERPGREGEQQVIDALRNGSKIEAIKIYREIHNVGLAEAKIAVDALETKHGL